MTSSTAIQAEVAALEEQLEPMNGALDDLYQDFVATLPPHVEKWMKGATKRKVEERADKVNDAGLDPLRLLKADLAELTSRLPDLCAQAAGPSAEWPHRKVKLASRTSGSDYTSESHAATSFRKAIANLGALFAKHGMLESPPGHSRDWEPNGQGKYKYAYNPGFDEREFPCLARYNELRTTQQRRLDLLELKRQELAKAKARELWDEA